MARMGLLRGALVLAMGLAAQALLYEEHFDAMGNRLSLEAKLAYQARKAAAIAALLRNMLKLQEGSTSECRPPPTCANSPFNRSVVEDLNWQSPRRLGQVSGVSVDPLGRPVIFHRGHHRWEIDSFDADNQYTKQADGPIAVNTVLTLSPESGAVEDAWGSGAFYLPHGVHVDTAGNFWLTDVALHQVFKFPRRDGSGPEEPVPSLVLGERFVPGDDARHFCQPTAVAVSPDGEMVVVADGYCNQRLLVFDSRGHPIQELPPRGDPDFLTLRVPHSLTIRKNGDICVADREHQRIVCFYYTRITKESPDGSKKMVLSKLAQSDYRPAVCRIFGIASYDDWIYVINGPTTNNNIIKGFTLNPEIYGELCGIRGQPLIVATWQPTFMTFTNPHGIAVSPNGTALYVSEIGPNVVWKFNLLTNHE